MNEYIVRPKEDPQGPYLRSQRINFLARPMPEHFRTISMVVMTISIAPRPPASGQQPVTKRTEFKQKRWTECTPGAQL